MACRPTALATFWLGCRLSILGLIVVDNPGRIVSTGLNIAVARSQGDIIIRIDGHALIASDFVRENVALLAAHPEAWSVGGPIRHAATTTLGKAVAVAMSHPLGVGNARHRYPEFEGYVEGAQFPAIRRWVFDRIGMFDERLVRNQDDEFNYRIRRAGGKIYVSPRVQYSYFVRERLGQLFKQYFQYGFWRIPVVEKHRRPTTLRQMAPTLFYAACVVLAVAGLWWRAAAARGDSAGSVRHRASPRRRGHGARERSSCVVVGARDHCDHARRLRAGTGLRHLGAVLPFRRLGCSRQDGGNQPLSAALQSPSSTSVRNIVGITAANPHCSMIKRLVDLLVAGVALVVTSPLFLLAAIGIRLASPGPIFYRAKRIGRDLRRVHSDFRSMAHPTERRRQDGYRGREFTM